MFTIQNEAPHASPWLGGYNLHAMGLHKDYTCHGLIQQGYIMQNTDGAKWECTMSQCWLADLEVKDVSGEARWRLLLKTACKINVF